MERPVKSRRKKQEDAFLTALACGATVETAATKAGISERTGFRRLKDPEFQKRLAEFKAETVRRSADMLSAASLEAAKTLLELQKPSTPPQVRLGAARATIDLGSRMRESNHLEERLAALESKMIQPGQRPGGGPP